MRYCYLDQASHYCKEKPALLHGSDVIPAVAENNTKGVFQAIQQRLSYARMA